jgi:DGQHR domain-containing protein
VTQDLRLPAIRITQGASREIICFAVDGKLLHRFATVSRVRRGAHAQVEGYQRPEVIAHVKAIRSYIESRGAMIPNALVVAFDDRVCFEGSGLNGHDGPGEHGTLVVPVDDDLADADKPGWIVDGQQRAAALRDARVDGFPIFVSAFVAASEQDQRSQFILVNSTKPLPKGLIHELLPSTDGKLPPALQRRRFPAYLLDRLNYDEDSALRLRIRTPTQSAGVVKDNSILRMIENSLTDGVLYRYRNPETGAGEAERMLAVLKAFWEAVSLVFFDAWDLPPRRSRLLHGVGVGALGFLMDAIAEDVDDLERDDLIEVFVGGLSRVDEACAWTGGAWQLADDDVRKWNELQNTPKDIQKLASYLLGVYREAAAASAAPVG